LYDTLTLTTHVTLIYSTYLRLHQLEKYINIISNTERKPISQLAF